MPKSNTSDRAYDVITQRILDALEQGEVPWRKPWSVQAGLRPQNAISKRPYSGINAFLLGWSGYTDPRWITFRAAKANGGSVRKGEKATPIVFYKRITRKCSPAHPGVVCGHCDIGNPGVKSFGILKYFNVFNVEQIDGLDLEPIEAPDPAEAPDPIEAAEAIIAAAPNPPSLDHAGGNQAYYIPAKDEVHLPPRESFGDAGEYYATVFHELGHATGHESRLNRHGLETGIAPFGSKIYSKEELAAEFASAFLCNTAGIENTIDNSAAYIAGWARALRQDKKIVVQAASQGQKAADYILGAGEEAPDA
jgi:antirestriction protein ArdC